MLGFGKEVAIIAAANAGFFATSTQKAQLERNNMIIEKHNILVLNALQEDVVNIEASLKNQARLEVHQRDIASRSQFETTLTQGWDLILCAFEMPALNPSEALQIARKFQPDVPFIFLSREASVEQVVDLMRAGARGFVAPTDLQRLVEMVSQELMNEASAEDTRYRNIVDTQTEFICRYDPDFRLTFVNQAYCDWIGASREALIGVSFLSRIHEQDRAQAIAHVRSLSVDNPVSVSVHSSILADGQFFVVEWTDQALFDSEGRVIEYQGIGRDVTLRELAAQQLQALSDENEMQRKRIQDVLDTMQDALMCLAYPERRILFASAAFEKVFGYPAERFINDPTLFTKVVPPEDVPVAVKAIQTCLEEGFVELDHRIIWPDGQVRWVHRRAWVNYDAQGNPVQINDSARDITARKQAEAALRESLDWIQIAFEAANLGKWQHNLSTGEVRFDERGRLHAGFESDTVSLEMVFNRVYPEDRSRLQHEMYALFAATDSDGRFSAEYRVLYPDGSMRWLAMQVKLYYEGEGEERHPTVAFGTSQDITERKNAEATLRASEEKYRSLIESSDATISMVDYNGRYLYLNQISAAPFGVSPEALVGKTVHDLFSADQAEQILADIRDVIDQERGIVLEPKVTVEGKPSWFRTSIQPVRDGSGKPYAALLHAAEITEKKLTEQALQHQNEILRQSRDLISMADSSGRILYVNAGGAALLGADTPEALIGRSISEFHRPEDAQQFVSTIFPAVAEAGQWRGESLLKTLDGSLTPVDLILFPIRDVTGVITHFATIMSDISQKKQAENNLRLLQAAVQNSSDAIIICDTDVNIVFVNPAFTTITGYFPEDVLGRSPAMLLSPETPQEVLLNLVDNLFSGQDFTGELKTERKEGGPLHVEWSTSPIRNDAGDVAHYVTIMRDVHTRKLAEDALRASELQLRSLIKSQTNYVIRIDLAGNYRYCNEKFEQEFGWIFGEKGWLGSRALDSICPHHHQRTLDVVKQCLANPETVFQVELDKPLRNGGATTTLWEFIALTDSEGEPTEIQCVGIDITMRKQAEDAVQASEERFRSLIDTAPVAILLTDKNGKITSANQQTHRIFGYDDGELLNQPIEVLVPETTRRVHTALRSTFIESPQRRRMAHRREVQALHKDGHYFPVEIELGYLREGDDITVMTFVTDITERKQAQATLEYQASLLRQVSDAIIATDRNLRITAWNDAATRIYGWTEAEAMGQSIDELLRTEWPYEGQLEAQTSFEASGQWRGEIRQYTKAGEPRAILSSVSLTSNVGSEGGGVTVNHDITERKRQETLQLRISQILEAVAEAHPLKSILEILTLAVEEYQPALRASVLLLENATGRVRHGAAPRLPDAYNKAIDGLVIGSCAGSCGTAAYRKKLVIVEDIQIDPLWADYRDLALQYGLRACWSQPILNVDGEVLGTFALYYGKPQRPTEAELDLIRLAAHLAGIAIRRKQAEDALRASEDMFRRFMQHIAGTVFIFNHENHLVYCNDQYAASLNARAEDIIGKSIDAYVSPDLAKQIRAEDTYVLSQNQVFENDFGARTDGKYRHWRIIKFPIPQENAPSLVGAIAIDVTKEKLGEYALRASEEKYRSLIESSNAVIAMFKADGETLFVNAIAAQSLGLAPEEIIGKNLVDLFPPNIGTGHLQRVQQVIQTGQGVDVENRSVVRGEERWYRSSVQPVRDAFGQVTAALVHSTDITDFKAAEAALRQSEEQFQQFMRYLPGAVFIKDVQQRVFYCNDLYVQLIDRPPEDIIGKDAYEYLSPELMNRFVREDEKLLESGRSTEFIQSIPGPDGMIDWFIIKFPIPRENDLPLIGGIGLNVTRERRAEAALRQSEEQFQQFMRYLPGVVFINDEQQHLVYCNEMYGWVHDKRAEDLIGKRTYEFTDAEHADLFFEEDQRVIAEGRAIEFSDLHVGPEGTDYWYKIKFPIPREGQTPLIGGIALNITREKRAEDALRISEARQRALLEAIPDLMFRLNLDDVILNVHAPAPELLIADPQDFIGKRLQEVCPPVIVTQHREAKNRVLATQHAAPYEYQLMLGSTLHDFEARLLPVGEDEFLTIIRDVTERKQAEAALRASEKRYRQMFEVHGLPKLIVDPETGQIVDANWAAAEFYGYSIAAFKKLKIFDLTPSASESIMETMSKVVASDIVSREYVHYGAGRRERNVEVFTGPVEIDGKTLLYSIITDVTERKQAEAALQAAHDLLEQRVTERTAELEKVKNRLEAIFNHSGDSILLVDLEHGIQQANYAFEHLLDMTEASYLGIPLSAIVHPEDAPAIEMTIHTVIEQHETRHLEMQVKRADGTFVDVEISIAPVNRSEAAITNLVCIIRDVRERKQAQRAIAEERNLLRTIIDTMPDHIYIKDRQHRFMLSNAAHTRHYNQGGTLDLIGKTDYDLFTAEESAIFHAAEDAIFETEQPILNLIEQGVNEDGSDLWILTTKIPLRNLNGEVIGLLGLAINITAIKAGETALLRSQADLRSVIDSTNTAFVLMDQEGVIRVTNKLAQDMSYLRYGKPMLLGHNVFEYIIPEAHDRFRAEFARVLNGEMLVMEEPLSTPEKVLYFEIRYFPVMTPDGKVIGVNASFENITERKNAEAVLKQKYQDELVMQAYLRTLHEVSIELARTETLDEFYRLTVDLGKEHFGFDRMGLLLYDLEHDLVLGTYGTDAHGNTIAEHQLRLNPGDRTGILKRTMDRAKRFAFDEEALLYDNNGLIGEGNSAAAALWDDELLGWLKVDNAIHHRPISKAQLDVLSLFAMTVGSLFARKRAEQMALSLSRRLDLATRSGGIGIWEWDIQSDRLDWDDRMYGLYGLVRGDEPLTSQVMLQLIHPDDAARSMSETDASMAEGRLYDTEFRIIRPDGEIRHIKATGIISYDVNGKPTRVVGVNLDLTDLKRSEEALRLALEKEKELGELKSRFVSMASHEFRTPLAVILAAAESLSIYRSKMDDAQIDARLVKIRQHVNHMKNIMEDVLHLARIQAGRVDFRPAKGDLDALFRELVEEYEQQVSYQGRIIYNGPNGSLEAYFDERLMRQAVSNLLSNALKYSPIEKPVYLHLFNDVNSIIITVIDEGIGIPPEDQKHLFEPFHRARNVGTIPGTGLGLSITKQAVEMHSGTIGLNNESGVGTTFVVTLPTGLSRDYKDD
jgi:PAS domain S-box-containing protein